MNGFPAQRGNGKLAHGSRFKADVAGQLDEVVAGREPDVGRVAGVATLLRADEEHLGRPGRR